MSKDERSNAPPSKTLARGLEVLEHVALSNRAMRLKDVANAFDMDMASAHRILKTLEEMGYLDRLTIGRAYGPGQKLRMLANPLFPTERMIEALRPLVHELSETTGQVSHVGILQDSQVMLAEVALTPVARISVKQAVGDVEELYCSAIGKAILAFLPRSEQQPLLRAQSYFPHTEFTYVTKSALLRELGKIASSDISFDDREGSLDIACIAAPVLDQSGYPVAAIGISSISSTLDGPIAGQTHLISAVRKTAAQASALLA